MRFILAPCFKLKAGFGSRSRESFFAWRSTGLNVRSTDRQSGGASVLLGRVRGPIPTKGAGKMARADALAKENGKGYSRFGLNLAYSVKVAALQNSGSPTSS